jgi:ABC-type nitrate/sulfonate/bicarbonate transport system substrate-binding protein
MSILKNTLAAALLLSFSALSLADRPLSVYKDHDMTDFRMQSLQNEVVNIHAAGPAEPLVVGLTASYLDKQSGVEIKVQKTSNEAAVSALANGQADIAVLSRKILDNEMGMVANARGKRPVPVRLANPRNKDSLPVFAYSVAPEKGSLGFLDYALSASGQSVVAGRGWSELPSVLRHEERVRIDRNKARLEQGYK